MPPAQCLADTPHRSFAADTECAIHLSAHGSAASIVGQATTAGMPASASSHPSRRVLTAVPALRADVTHKRLQARFLRGTGNLGLAVELLPLIRQVLNPLAAGNRVVNHADAARRREPDALGFVTFRAEDLRRLHWFQ